MTPRLRLRVDRIACDGRGLCAELLPELVALDDWGYPILRTDVVPDHLVVAAREAVELCPVLALHLKVSTQDALRPGGPASSHMEPPITTIGWPDEASPGEACPDEFSGAGPPGAGEGAA